MKASELVIALGTRAELIKMAPVMRALQKEGLPYYFLHTGQHGIRDLIRPLVVKKPDEELECVESRSRGRFGSATVKALFWNLRSVHKIGKVLSRLRPKIVVCHGDTMSTAAIAVAAKRYSPSAVLCHVEAGLRSHDLREPFPEEVSRRLTDFLSDVLFVPTPQAANNLKGAAYRNKRIFVTGNTNVDVLLENLPKAKVLPDKLIPPKPFVFAQIHRQENIRSRERCSAFVDLLCRIPYPIVFVFLKNTWVEFSRYGLVKKIREARNIRVRPNLPYLVFLKVFSNAACVVTDSGGQTEEAAVLKIPTVIFRNRNERHEAEECGVAVRVGSDERKALHYVLEALQKKEFYLRAKRSKNPFGDGRAGERIARELAKLLKQ